IANAAHPRHHRRDRVVRPVAQTRDRPDRARAGPGAGGDWLSGGGEVGGAGTMISSIDDKDRIFTNIYGYQDWGLEGAQKRGDWDNTKDLMIRGQDQIIEDVKASG